ncbi:MAG: DUF4892 domain-containing protein [Endozoicomonas sp.]
MARVNRSFSGVVTNLFRGFGAGILLIPAFSVAGDLAGYPNATLDLEVQEARSNHPLVSSSMKKVNGVVLADEQKFLNGWLDRKVYLLPPGHDSDQAFDFFTRQFDQMGVETLYSCQQFSCGDSNFWANNTFNIARLYGLEKTQAYSIGSLTMDDQEVFYLTYTVRRGNRRVYALVDVFTPEKVGSDRIIATEEYLLNRLPTDVESLKRSSSYSDLLGLLKNDNSKKLLVLLESTVPGSLKEIDTLMDTKKRFEKAVIDQLGSDGIEPKRVRIQETIRPVGENNGQVRIRILRME